MLSLADNQESDSSHAVAANPAARVRWTHWFALATAISVFPLLFVGAGVTSKDAGMAFPDWPTSNGALVNPENWTKSEHTFWEHGHRLLGWWVGMLCIALVVAALFHGRTIRVLAIATLLAVSIQGVLGGLRVTQTSTVLAMVHGVWGQLCFCLAACTALISSAWWSGQPRPTASRAGASLRRLCIATSVVLIVQLALGASLRHFGRSGAVVAHVLFAVPVVFFIGLTAMSVIGAGFDARTRAPSRLAAVVGILAGAQLFLGALAWIVTMNPGDAWWLAKWLVPTIHVAAGALILMGSILLTCMIFRLTWAPGASAHAPALSVTAA